MFSMSQIESLLVTFSKLRDATRRDVLHSMVVTYTKHDWPTEIQESLCPYWNRRHELTVEDDCLLWGSRVVVLKKLREKLLHEPHRDHSGMSSSYV